MYEDETSLLRHRHYQEELARLLERKFWKGPDLATVNPILLDQKVNLVPIVLSPNAWPDLGSVPPVTVDLFKKSLRSRYALLGLHLGDFIDNHGDQLAHSAVWEMAKENPRAVSLLVFKLGQRPVQLLEGSHLFRFYYPFAARPLRGQDLIDRLNTKEIEIKGEQGEDWQWLYLPQEPRTVENIIGAQVRIKERYWIPPHPKNEPISINDQGPYRDQIEQLWEPVTPNSRLGSQSILWLGKTPHITIGGRINAILLSFWLDTEEEGETPRLFRQTESRLIDAGTDWPVLIESFNRPITERMPNWAPFCFWEDS